MRGLARYKRRDCSFRSAHDHANLDYDRANPSRGGLQPIHQRTADDDRTHGTARPGGDGCAAGRCRTARAAARTHGERASATQGRDRVKRTATGSGAGAATSRYTRRR